jgi:N-acetylglucosaminyldiphosphoundecaprenol N-acetyl-beta-D-mannosaminyltransferase
MDTQSSLPSRTITVLGIPISVVDMKQTLEAIERMVSEKTPRYIVTANVDFVVQSQEDQELQRILCDADLVVCDGMPLVWASRWFGNPLPERVAGSDMAPLLLDLADRKRLKVYLLGAETSVNAKAAETIRYNYSNLDLVGNYSPPYVPLVEMDHDDINRRVREANPDILLVGFGCPKQEKWIDMNFRQANAPVAIGVGATLDFLAGKVSRAPVWMRKVGLEWVYRLALEPRRLWKRYGKGLIVFATAIVKHRRYLRSLGKSPRITSAPSSTPKNPFNILELPETFDAPNVNEWHPAITEHVTAEASPRFNLAKIKSIDSTGLGELLQIRKLSKQLGKAYVLHQSSEAVMKLVKLTNLESQLQMDPKLPEGTAVGESQNEPLVTSQLISEKRLKRIAWSGKLGSNNADSLLTMTQNLVVDAPEGFNEIEINLSEVAEITSATVVTMRKVKQLATHNNKLLRFLSANDNVVNVLTYAKELRLLD